MSEVDRDYQKQQIAIQESNDKWLKRDLSKVKPKYEVGFRLSTRHLKDEESQWIKKYDHVRG